MIMRYATIYFFLLAGLAMLCSCRTTTKYVPVERIRTEYREADTTGLFNRLLRIVESRKEKTLRVDSIIDKEKELVVMNEKGDTTRHNKERIIYRATEREKELEKENKTLRDSLSVVNARLESVRADSVPVPYPVERELSKWERAKIDYGGKAILGLGVMVVVCIAVVWLARKGKGR